jgi:hypothetical protein
MVLATVCCWRTPRPSVAVQRSRLWARVAASSQAALALNCPEGRCASPLPALRSRMASSQTAWRRWSVSSQVAVPGRSVTKAW